MFTKIKLQNFRSFDKIEFDLTLKNNIPKNLVFVYGENGAGKSNLLSAFVLLNELIDTMDLRDVYEELLKRESFTSDERMERFFREKIMEELRDIQSIIDDYRMIDNDEPIIAEYEFYIGGNIGRYYVELGKEEIQHERLEYLLNKRRGVYFDCTSEKLSINSSIVTDKDLFADIKATAKRYWGKHSFLAIIFHELRDKSKSFGRDNIAPNFYDVLTEFRMLSCNIEIGHREWNRLSAPSDVLVSPEEDEILKTKEEQLDITEKILTGFFSAINSDINKAFYKRSYTDKYVKYELFLEKMIAGSYRNIPFSKESTGNQQLLKVLCYTLSACLGVTVVIDEADAGIHDLLFQKMMVEIQPKIEGQLIITTHNTLLMETEFAREAVYVMQEDEDRNKEIRCITDYGKRTYFNNNIRNKYLNNEYKGVPSVKKIEFSSLLQMLIDSIENTKQV